MLNKNDSLYSNSAEETQPVMKRPKGRPKSQRETKKRISLVVYPSIYAQLQEIALADRQSVSDIVTKLMAEYVKANSDKLSPEL